MGATGGTRANVSFFSRNAGLMVRKDFYFSGRSPGGPMICPPTASRACAFSAGVGALDGWRKRDVMKGVIVRLRLYTKKVCNCCSKDR